jgi:gliding motility-associated lipoprotein GldB
MKKSSIYLLPFIAIVVLFSCGDKRTDVDVSEVEIPNTHINRLEQDVFTMDKANMLAASEHLQKKYGTFYTTYNKSVLNNGGMKDSSFVRQLKRFISDKDMREAYSDCQKMYPDLAFLEEEMTDMFKHFNYYFPKRKTPQVITMMSGFNYSSIIADSTLAIGLEMYLGSKNKFYPMLGLPYYKIMFMGKENIASDVLRTWMFEEFKYNMNKNDFLSDIVYLGKIIYLNDAMLPDVNDTIKMQYTQKQLDYCIQNEFNIWTYFIAQKLLYTTDRAEIMKFTGEGPFTSALSKEAPPRIGYWIGLQIVRQYMKNNPDVTLEQLMNETDAQKILAKSKYKPKK